MKREDSPNRKRYRVKSSDGYCISYGLCVTPLVDRANELLEAAKEIERSRKDRIFVRKQILTKLSIMEEHDVNNPFLSEVRKLLRRKLTIDEYRDLFAKVDAEHSSMSTAVDGIKTHQLSVNDGQIVRHHSKSLKEQKDYNKKVIEKSPELPDLINNCDQAVSYAPSQLKTWNDIERHAMMLAPMMGISENAFNDAKSSVGPRTASCAIFIMLQFGNRIRDFRAYFHSITLGKKVTDFDPSALLVKLANRKAPLH